jgi:hypothetical protein
MACACHKYISTSVQGVTLPLIHVGKRAKRHQVNSFGEQNVSGAPVQRAAFQEQITEDLRASGRRKSQGAEATPVFWNRILLCFF